MSGRTHDSGDLTRVEWILFSTAFAAGAVDIIGFTLRRGRAARQTVSLPLAAETVLLLVFALTPGHHAPADRDPGARDGPAVATALAAHGLLRPRG